jgi:hypothetical protein|tara:strand:+ start:357 stop:464 length:108 start_codon:yes stop_codon:yes gene_type:complete
MLIKRTDFYQWQTYLGDINESIGGYFYKHAGFISL